MIPFERFLELPTEEVAALVKANGPRVCAFPFNGTRRWFLLEHGLEHGTERWDVYVETTTHAYIRLYQLLFDHGIETILAPVIGSETLARGEEYMTAIGENMRQLAEHPAFRSFYHDHDVRVRFYGDYRKALQARYPDIITSFDKTTEQTLAHTKHRLLYGVFADEATETLAELSVQYYLTHRKIPSRAELIQMYYGEAMDRADLFIGFERYTIYDQPMLLTGFEDLYFTVAPSLYMSQTLFRTILYDHMYVRPQPEPEYSGTSQHELEAMRKVYQAACNYAFGIGELQDGVWYAKR